MVRQPGFGHYCNCRASQVVKATLDTCFLQNCAPRRTPSGHWSRWVYCSCAALPRKDIVPRVCSVNEPGSLVQARQHFHAGRVECWCSPASRRLRSLNIKQPRAKVYVFPLQSFYLTGPQSTVGGESSGSVG